MPTIAVVATTMIITALKSFDIVYTLTNGNFGTDVIAEPDVQGDVHHSATSGGPAPSRSCCWWRSSRSWPSTSAASARRRPSDDGRVTNRSARSATAVAKRAEPQPAGRLGLHAVVIVLMAIWLMPDDRPAHQLVPARGRCRRLRLVDGALPAIATSRSTTTSTCSARTTSGDAFVNSLFITIPATVIPIMVAAFAAYAFAWMDFPGQNVALRRSSSGCSCPAPVDPDPGPAALRRLGHRRGVPGGLARPHGLWPAVRDLPAAELHGRACRRRSSSRPSIDGASPATAFFRLALPMSVPAIAALAIFQFLFVWNDLLVVAHLHRRRPTRRTCP